MVKTANELLKELESLHEGYIRKGGTNPEESQVQTRPAAPAPMRPASSQAEAPKPAKDKSGQ
jgi:hypothetical protein